MSEEDGQGEASGSAEMRVLEEANLTDLDGLVGEEFGDRGEDGADGSEADSQSDGGLSEPHALPSVEGTEWGTMSKSEAKKKLSKADYKKWKKQHGKEKKKKKDKRGRKGEKKESGKGSRPAKNRRRERETGASIENTGSLPAKRRRREKELAPVPEVESGAEEPTMAGEGIVSGEVARKRGVGSSLSKQQKEQLLREEAKKILAMMRTARCEDDLARRQGRPPLQRITIKNDVIEGCRRIALHEYLVKPDGDGETSILDELANWIYDKTRKEFGPLDLRTTALDLLLAFEVSGVTHMYAKPGKSSSKKDDSEELHYEGIGRFELENSSIGKAVNLLRKHDQESARNRNVACKLLQRFSCAFSGEALDDVEEAEPKWGSMGDPDVLPPFNTLKTASEMFHQRIMKVDDQDPTSYARLPPRRIEKTLITNLKPK
jgi:hypothetical protein